MSMWHGMRWFLPSEVGAALHLQQAGLVQGAGVNVDAVAISGDAARQRFVILRKNNRRQSPSHTCTSAHTCVGNRTARLIRECEACRCQGISGILWPVRSKRPNWEIMWKTEGDVILNHWCFFNFHSKMLDSLRFNNREKAVRPHGNGDCFCA